VSAIYPWLYEKHMVDTVAVWLQSASSPFEPLLKWRMSSEKFPINSMELYMMNMVLSILLYVVVSLLTCREPFNMDRMLHRGEYHREGKKVEFERITLRKLIPHLIGIDNQYSRGDKIMAWAVFLWSFVWLFGCAFVGVAMWNFISPWSNAGWSRWFFTERFLISATTVGLISMVWFTIGGTLGLRKLFKELATAERNSLDDGRVIGHVSADDLTMVQKAEHASKDATHISDEMPQDELKKENARK
jgi:SSS family solute:Na+ symporter